MAHHSGYSPGQVYSPPELPKYLKNVYELKQIVGVPSDAEVIEICAVMHAARKASEVPGMHDPSLLMNLADHLFSVQMARYRNKYLQITSPLDAIYTPPTLPAHIPVNLEPVSGVPSDEDMLRVQEAVRIYQRFESVPSMFDQGVNMELSQHLFNLQMSRHMRLSGENTQSPPLGGSVPRSAGSAQVMGRSTDVTKETPESTNNSGAGASAPVEDPPSQPTSTDNIRELMDGSNQLAERFNLVLERFTQAFERAHETSPQSDRLTERFNQLLERFNLMTERSNQLAQQSAETSNQLLQKLAQPVPVEQLSQPMEQSNRLIERFNQLFEQSNGLISQLLQPLQQSNDLSGRANELAERLNQLAEQSNTISDRGNKPIQRLEGVMQNINRVLVGIQHAIVRNCKDNKATAVDCLVNMKGETPASSRRTGGKSYEWMLRKWPYVSKLPVTINGSSWNLVVPDTVLPQFVCFYGIWEGLCATESSSSLLSGKESEARERLSSYLSSCLG
ncbi:unnamed protein product [Rhizoctonia solani]|uniref:Laminin domain protein n=1 Tax=Rhizoctonia solani TaxID=456999 RepID=A0A8H3E5C5_9AGAM|nr:unnamed protein product [Rhizoctonia solani]